MINVTDTRSAVKQTEDDDLQRDSEEEVKAIPDSLATGSPDKDGATTIQLRGKLLATESLLEMEKKEKGRLQQEIVELKWTVQQVERQARQIENKLKNSDQLNNKLCLERTALVAALEQKEAQVDWEIKV